MGEGLIRVVVFHNSIACRWVAKSGGRLRLPKECDGIEVSPTVSYSGEGLRPVCRGRTFRQQHDMFLQVLFRCSSCSKVSSVFCHLQEGAMLTTRIITAHWHIRRLPVACTVSHCVT